MKIKTQDLIGPALDWAVSTIEGDGTKYGPTPYSTDQDLGGMIIDREGIRTGPESFTSSGFRSWRADIPMGPVPKYGYVCVFGPTRLVAAMRCHVTNKLGFEIDVPEELL